MRSRCRLTGVRQLAKKASSLLPGLGFIAVRWVADMKVESAPDWVLNTVLGVGLAVVPTSIVDR